ncbi:MULTISPECIES: hypothetical protein [unclassified Psychrobacter]|uniref:hypothetical protein n=1 Tax=unclassified Psychrobacter TaxID=196806 RepID=UPI00040E42ED|nr:MULTISPECIES: hypothetical protein [unclassified Psychrobacter]
MENQPQLFKGELLEEKLRSYFLNNGYYVVRGAKYSYKGHDITDIDLLLYGRVSSLSRERTNVDIKNKKSPKAFERILWAKGLQQLLGFDNCVVATTDKKDVVGKFGKKHNTTILDGNFLNKLIVNEERISEEELTNFFDQFKSFREFKHQSWKSIYENSKSRLLNELDFSGYNSTLLTLKYFIEKCFDDLKKETALRATYILLSHSFIILDYILKDIAFLEPSQRRAILKDGFMYGNLGQSGVNRTIEMAIKIAGSDQTVGQIKNSLDTGGTDILEEYFSKVEAIKNVFKWALAFEEKAFDKNLVKPQDLDSNLKGSLALMLDFFNINRTDFFKLYR